MEVILKKYFVGFDVFNMEEWLNEQGQKGLRLSRLANNKYVFEQTENVYYYRIAYVNPTLSYAEQQAFIHRLLGQDLIYITRQYNWAYYYRTEPIISERSQEEKAALLKAMKQGYRQMLVPMLLPLVSILSSLNSLNDRKVSLRVFWFLLLITSIFVVYSSFQNPFKLYKRYKELKSDLT
ncbi:DUF2812 domain-containing protein [Streptococcus fryi]